MQEDFENNEDFTEDESQGNGLVALLYKKAHWVVFFWSILFMVYEKPKIFDGDFLCLILFGLVIRGIAHVGGKIGEQNFYDVTFLGHQELTERCFKAACWGVAVATPIIIYYCITDEYYHYGFWRYIQSIIVTLTFGIAA